MVGVLFWFIFVPASGILWLMAIRDTELWPHTLFSVTFRSFPSIMPFSFVEPIYTFASIMFYSSECHSRIV